MGHSGSKNPKINKNHDKQKMLKIGISVGRNDLTLEGHFQLGYHGKTIKNLRKPLSIPYGVRSSFLNVGATEQTLLRI